MTDLERLARALAGEHVDTLLGREELEFEVYEAMTRAVLRELREPSPETSAAGAEPIADIEAMSGAAHATFILSWQAAIDSILGEGEGDEESRAAGN